MPRFHTTNKDNAIEFVADLRERGYSFDPTSGKPSCPLVPMTYRTYMDKKGYVVAYREEAPQRTCKPVYQRKEAPKPGQPFTCECGETKHHSGGLCRRCFDRWYYWNNQERRRKQIARAKMAA